MHVPTNSGEALVIGIYLTALTDEARLQKIVTDFSELPSVGSIFIRTHPTEVVNTDLSGIIDQDGPVEMSCTRPLDEDIARTDIAVCGNSTVTIELLHGGRPVLYDQRLDQIDFDYNGYAGHGLVLAYPDTLNDGIFNLARQHYQSCLLYTSPSPRDRS